MGGDRGVRHRCKEHLYSLEQEFRHDYGLSVIASRALVQRYVQLLDEVQEDEGGGRGPGQVRVVAVAAGQPAGRPLSQCVTLPVLVTLVAPTDAEVQRTDGSRGVRQARLVRMTHEAWGQGGLLSYDDLSLLLAVDVSTVRRSVRRCRAQCLSAGIGVGARTNGQVTEIKAGYEKEPAAMVKKELPRIEKVNRNARIAIHVFGALALVGLILHFAIRAGWSRGLGSELVLVGALGLLLEGSVDRRAEPYTKALVELGGKHGVA